MRHFLKKWSVGWLSKLLGGALIVLAGLGSSAMPEAEAAGFGRPGVIIFSTRADALPPEVPPPVASDYDLFTLRPGAAVVQRITTGSEADFHPSWSPTANKIAFARSPHINVAADIYVINKDGSDAINLTETPTHVDVAPDWSPDGTKIVFGSALNEPIFLPPTLNQDLYVMDSDGSELQPFLTAPGSQGFPAWSPDGEWIAYSDLPRDCGGPIACGSIRVVSADGSRQRTVAETSQPALYADWSPDGKWIAFESGGDVYIVRRNGSGLLNLTPDSPETDFYPTWSPDGRRIAFMSERSGSNRLYVMDADGDNVRELIDIDLVGAFGTDWGPRP